MGVPGAWEEERQDAAQGELRASCRCPNPGLPGAHEASLTPPMHLAFCWAEGVVPSLLHSLSMEALPCSSEHHLLV